MVNKEENRKPRISVIIPSYNYALFIPEALKSLQEQVFANWECWVVDDGSTDSTAAAVQEIAATDNRIHYIYQVNQGQPAARNTGLQQARGEYIQFLDADDVLEPMKFVVQLSYLDQHAGADIVYGEVCYFKNYPPIDLFINRWGDPMEEWMPKLSGKGMPMIKALVEQNIFELGCALFRKTAIESIGAFSVDLQGVEDYDFCFRAAVKELSFVYLHGHSTGCLMRHHPESFSKKKAYMYRKELMLRTKMMHQLKETGNHELIAINKDKFTRRLKRLQDYIIDQAIKKKRISVERKELKWLLYHSSLPQNIYFFPRLAKALLSRSPANTSA